MESTVCKIGFSLFCFFFLLAFLVQLSFAWGCLLGLAVCFFGLFFWEE